MKRSNIAISLERIEKAIFLVRGERVMLDRELAVLYGVETRVLNQAVMRNQARFPGDFMFELTRAEITGISQTVTSSKLRFSKRVTAFTEQGVAMLSSVLRSKRAIQVNVEVMRAFVRLRSVVGTRTETLLENLGFEDVTVCDIPVISALVSSNMKSPGNLAWLRITA